MRGRGKNERRVRGSTRSIRPKSSDGTKPRPDLVLVTVNDHETKAVHDAFLAETGAEGVPVSIEGRLYHNLGAINGTTVYHAISEMGSGGLGSMQQVVDMTIRALDPGAVIAIGIAFGVSEKNQAIGDILLSRQIQLYELQRAGNEIILRGDKAHAAVRLINHFDTFKQIKWKGATVRTGLILSGEKLIDNKDYRDELLKLQVEAVGGEMEGAGLYVASVGHKVDWIVIKAICDWADGKKGANKKHRQQKAAKNAADFLVQSLKYAALRRGDSTNAVTPSIKPTQGNRPNAATRNPQTASNSPAIASGRVIYSKSRKEWLYSNLLRATGISQHIYVANTSHRYAGTVWSALRQEGGDIGPEWALASKQIISFRDLGKPPWHAICEGAQACDTREWSESDDFSRRRDFVRLLNHCLRALTRSIGLGYRREMDCYCFLPTPDLKPRPLTYRSLQQNATRDVFAVYYKKSDPETVSHFRHAAFVGSFQRYDYEWYLQINPTYVYTVDGYHLSRFHSELLSGIKRFDRNPAVLGQVVMWGEFLNPDSPLFAEPYPYLQLGRPERLQVNRVIDDAAWKKQDSTAPKGKKRNGRP